MNITLGFSPCPNDTYMFAALVNRWIDTGDFHFNVHMADVEQLNEWGSSSFLDVTKLSFNRALSLEHEYELLPSGSALGSGCGPILIANKSLAYNEIIDGPIALPGVWTTANLLYDIFYPGSLNKQFYIFSQIEDLVLINKVAAGVIIHENRFTYAAKGLIKIRDLGEAWEEKTGLPIPLGGIFAHNRISQLNKLNIGKLIRESILFANHHPEKVMPYVQEHSQEMEESVLREHIRLYVNEFSLDLGEKGFQAVEALKNIR